MDDISIYTKTLRSCSWMYLHFSLNRARDKNMQATQETVLEYVSFEMVDQNDQASWIEQVAVQVILIGFCGTWIPSFVDRHMPFLVKLLALENRPQNALELLYTEPELMRDIESLEVVIP